MTGRGNTNSVPLAALELFSAAKIADLLHPGQVLLPLALAALASPCHHQMVESQPLVLQTLRRLRLGAESGSNGWRRSA